MNITYEDKIPLQDDPTILEINKVTADNMNEIKRVVNSISGAVFEKFSVGMITEFAGDNIPSGWLKCDGSAVSRTTYKDLFDTIGTAYGTGDGSTTFNLPNLKGRVPVGLDSSQTEFDTLGETGGSKELQRHQHQGVYSSNGGELTSFSPGGNIPIYDLMNLYNANGSVNAKITTSFEGTGNSGNLQPYIVVNYIIKATNTTATMATVVNTQSDSTEDTYSCDFINKVIRPTITTDANGWRKIDYGTHRVYTKSGIVGAQIFPGNAWGSTSLTNLPNDISSIDRNTLAVSGHAFASDASVSLNIRYSQGGTKIGVNWKNQYDSNVNTDMGYSLTLIDYS